MKQSVIAIVTSVILAGGAALSAQQAPPTAAKAEAAKAAASPAGKWVGSVESPGGTLTLNLDVQIDKSNKVTGTLTGTDGPTPIKGDLKEATLSFTFGYNAGGQTLEIYFEGKVNADGKLVGTMAAGDAGTFPFSAERAKGF